MRGGRSRWLLTAPACVLFLGLLGSAWLQPSARMSLEVPLAEFPTEIDGYTVEQHLEIPEAQLEVLRPDDYVLRRYAGPEGGEGFELFVSYYGQQLEGATIHSPRNCLPGGGWEPVEHRRIPLETDRYRGTVNRYVIQNRQGERALVYYWYQGRGRIEANEYRVKWDLLRDAVVERRTDEALVRLVFPLGEEEPTSLDASTTLAAVADSLSRHLPGG